MIVFAGKLWYEHLAEYLAEHVSSFMATQLEQICNGLHLRAEAFIKNTRKLCCVCRHYMEVD